MKAAGLVAVVLLGAGFAAIVPTTRTTSAPRILATLRVPSGPQAIATGDGGVWRRILATLSIPGAPSGAVESHGLLWIATSDTGYLFRVNPRAAKLVGKPVRAGSALLTVAAGRNRVWVGDSYADAVNSVDTRTGAVVTRTKLRHVSDVAAADGAVWATVDEPSELVQLDPETGREVGRALPVQGTASGLAIGFGSIWVLTADGVIRVRS